MTDGQRHWALAAGAAFVLADASIVALALPVLMVDLDAGVPGVAAVTGIYMAALALVLPLAVRLRGRRWLGPASFGLFGLVSAGCAAAGSLEVLLVLRAVQGVAGGGALVAVFPRLALPDGRGGRAWEGVSLLGLAGGAVVGGVLTEALDWRAIFAVQAPIGLAAAAAMRRTVSAAPDPVAATPERGPTVALALISAAIAVVVFALVLLLISGWSVSPLSAAAAVTVLPVAAYASSRVRTEPRVAAPAGCLLVAGGVGSLALVPEPSVWWLVVPQVLAGAGMGLALPALGGGLLPERGARQVARLLMIRHAGIALALAVLAPVVATTLERSLDRAQERGVALVLDADLPALDKVQLASGALSGLGSADPRAELAAALDRQAGRVDAADRPAFDRVQERADETIVGAAGAAFRPAFVFGAVLALLAAAACRPPAARWLLAPALAAGVCVGAFAVGWSAARPSPVVLADPCTAQRPEGGDRAERLALSGLDRIACEHGASREELVLALADGTRRRNYQRDHGVDPGNLGDLLRAIL